MGGSNSNVSELAEMHQRLSDFGPIRMRTLRAKLDRASGHLGEARRMVGDYVNENFRDMRGDINRPGEIGKGHLQAQWWPVPCLLGVVIGDVVHNLRSCLDHLANQLVSAHLGAAWHEATFPVVKAVQDVSGAWVPAEEVSISPGSVSADVLEVVKDAQPYTVGEHYQAHDLWILHELWNTDKHRAIVASPPWVGGYTSVPGSKTTSHTHGDWNPVKRTDDGMHFRFVPDDPEIAIGGDLYAAIRIDKGLPGVGQPVCELLGSLHSFTESLVNRLEPYLR